MIELAVETVIGYAGKTGMLGKIIDEINIIPHPPCQILQERLQN
jgi:hypothetical protein